MEEQEEKRKIDERLTAIEKKLEMLLPKSEVESDMPKKVPAIARFLSKIEGKPVCESTVYNRVASGTIPFHRKGSRLFFYESEILEAIRNAKSERGVAGVALVDKTREVEVLNA